jgi:hypothetical protein
VFEVVAVGDDGGLELADRAGTDPLDTIVVTTPPARSHGSGPVTVAAKLCGRVLPDGEGHRLAPGWFLVPDDVESDLVEILGEHDPITVALIAAELEIRDRAADPNAIDLRDLHRVGD